MRKKCLNCLHSIVEDIDYILYCKLKDDFREYSGWDKNGKYFIRDKRACKLWKKEKNYKYKITDRINKDN